MNTRMSQPIVALPSRPLDSDLARLAAGRGVATAAPDLTRMRNQVKAGDSLCDAGPDVTVSDTTLPGTQLELRTYLRPGRPPVATLLYLHGGGWVTGDLDYSDEFCRVLCHDLDLRVVSVDYRLAPEHPFPAALDDATTALRWAIESFGEDAPMGVAGDSAGGNLAAASLLHAREHGLPVDFQLLVYPVLDTGADTESYRTNAQAFGLGADLMAYFWRQYAAATPRESTAIAPYRADPAGLPSAVIVAAGHDPLHDEALAHAQRLSRAGVAVRFRDFPELCHGFLRMTGASPAARRARDEIVAGLDDLLGDLLDEATVE